jgi:hypothetical protein
MLSAEAAILAHFQPVGIVLLVLDGVVIALLALGAGQYNLDSFIRCHVDTSYYSRGARLVEGRSCSQQKQPKHWADLDIIHIYLISRKCWNKI